ncbi:MAG: STAS domain-containing protein, partial [Pseudomonadota bacterium]
MSEALLSQKLVGDRLELTARGLWTAPHAAELEAEINRITGGSAGAKSEKTTDVAIDMAGVRELDTFGAWLLERLTRQWTNVGRDAVVTGLPQHGADLVEEMHGVNREAPPRPEHKNPIVSFLAAIGRGTTGFAGSFHTFAQMLGETGIAAARVLFRPSEYRLTSTVHQFDRVALQAVPIIVLITFLIGAIVAQQ